MRHAIVLALIAGCAPAGGAAPPGLRVGAAEVDITPPAGLRMDGYFSVRLNTGARDPLLAKAIVFEQGGTRAALVFLDLLGVPRSVSDPARERAARRTGIPAANIAVAATHTHTGPLYYGPRHKIFHEQAVAMHGRDPCEHDYASFVTEKIAEVVEKAQAAARPARLEAGRAEPSPPISFNRRFHMKDGGVRTNPGAQNPGIVRPAGPIDPEAGVLVVRAGDRVAAALTVFALHLDTVGGTEYSADYPAVLSEKLRAGWDGGLVSLFGNGTCGDINHVDVTKAERAKTRDIGEGLAAAVLAAERRAVAPALAVRTAIVEAPLQKFPPEQVDRARKDASRVGSKDLPFLDQVRTCAILQLQELPPSIPLEVQAFRLADDTAIVTLPCEIFVDLGLAIKRASPFRNTWVIELANDALAYVPTERAFREGGYETVNSRVVAGTGERLVETATALLRELEGATSLFHFPFEGAGICLRRIELRPTR